MLKKLHYFAFMLVLFGALLGQGCVNQARVKETDSIAYSQQISKIENVQTVVLGDTLRAIVYSDHCFEQGTAKIRTSCKPALDNLITLLETYGNTPIKVAAYTDDSLGQASAKIFSAAQAQSIGAYLWTHGISFRQIKTVGYGRLNPIASNANVNGSAMNRRVEITLSAV